ncbi:MAG: hypothetical protein WC227_01130 [Patescibacteria group bacterium]|jgi:hypothetical protein
MRKAKNAGATGTNSAQAKQKKADKPAAKEKLPTGCVNYGFVKDPPGHEDW